MSPLQIRICLHYFTTPGDYKGPAVGSPIWNDTLWALMADALLEYNPRDGQLYHGTDKLNAYVESLQRVPLPEQVWKTVI